MAASKGLAGCGDTAGRMLEEVKVNLNQIVSAALCFGASAHCFATIRKVIESSHTGN